MNNVTKAFLAFAGASALALVLALNTASTLAYIDSNASASELAFARQTSQARVLGVSTVNIASSANGATASASSNGQYYPASAAINGERRGASGFWNDNTPSVWQDWLKVSFNSPKNLTEVHVYTNRDNAPGTADPTATETFSLFGIKDFFVEYSTDGTTFALVPGGNISGNNLVLRKLSFPAISGVVAIRIMVNNGLANYSRITEVEAYEATGTATPPVAPKIEFTSAYTLPGGQVGTVYTGVITFTYNGQNPLNIIFNKLAPGLSAGSTATPLLVSGYSPINGQGKVVIFGSPSVAGTFEILLTITDQAGFYASNNYSLTIAPQDTLKISTASLPDATVGVAYSTSVMFSYQGAKALTAAWSGLPAGINGQTLTGSQSPSQNGTALSLSGASSLAGTYYVTLSMTDQGLIKVKKDFTLVLKNPTSSGSGGGSATSTPTSTPVITNSSMPDGNPEQGQGYKYQFSATGGTTPYIWEIYQMTIPSPGIAINPVTGVVSSFYTIVNNVDTIVPLIAGQWQVGIRVTDANGKKAEKLFTWTVKTPNVARLKVYASASIPSSGPYSTYSANMNIWLKGQLYSSWGVKSQGVIFIDYPGQLTASDVKLEFTNDLFEPAFGTDVNLKVDRIEIDGQVYQTEDASVYASGGWTGAKCANGYLKTEWLYCNGYFQYKSVAGGSSNAPSVIIPLPPTIQTRVGALVRDSSGTVYLVLDNGSLMGVPSMAVLKSWCFSDINIPIINSAELALPKAIRVMEANTDIPGRPIPWGTTPLQVSACTEISPQVSFSANGVVAVSTDNATKPALSVKSGDTVNYQWSSTNAKTLTSEYMGVDSNFYRYAKQDFCAGGYGLADSQSNSYKPWVASTLSGSTTSQIQDCQKDVSYLIKVTGWNPNAPKQRAVWLLVKVAP